MRTGRRWPAMLLVVCVLVAGCGGGGGGGDTGGNRTVPGNGSTVAVSGTIRASPTAVADSDTNDSTRAKVPNDTFAQAQAIPSAATVGGYASAATDVHDVYRTQLAAGQTVTLDISDWNNGAADLDLCLYGVADTTNPVECLLGSTATETLTVAAAGEYFLVVEAAAGASNYLLRVGHTGTAAAAQRLAANEASAVKASPLALSSAFVPGEVVVRFKPNLLRIASAATVAARAASVGLAAKAGVPGGSMLLSLRGPAQRAKAFRALGIQDGAARLDGAPALPGGAPRDPALAEKLDTARVVKALRRRADVETADPNYLRHAYRVPNDPLYKFQWHYPLLRLPQAWDVTNPGTDPPALVDVVVAVVDSGVFTAHPDLSSKLLPGFDFVSDVAESNDGDGIDANADDPGDSLTPGGSTWHGTHVAGTVGARSDDGVGVAGVAWGARILPVRVLGRGGSGTSFDIIQGIRWAAGLSNDSGTTPPRKADILNLSFGGPSSSASEAAEFAAVRAAGVIIVAAAGNENTSAPSFPASYDGVVSVSAVDISMQRAPYSNTGPTVDVAAPGGDSGDRDGNGIPDGVVSDLVDDSSGSRVASAGALQGTSMAAPHVAGVAALMKTVCASLTPDQFDSLLAAGRLTQDLGTPGRDDSFGFGLIDALAAVQSAKEACGQAAAPFITIDPTRLDLGPSDSTASLRVAVRGTGAISVTSVTSDVPWLTVAPANVDANGIGTYAIAIDRTGLANGRVAGAVTVTPSSGSPVVVPVTLQVGGAAGAGDAGRLYVLLVDAQLNVVAQTVSDVQDGAYAYSFPNVAPGSYFVFAGSDADDDGKICDAGEACGAYPTLGDPNQVSVTAPRVGLDFSVAFETDLTTAASSPHRARPITPLRLMTAPKSLGGR